MKSIIYTYSNVIKSLDLELVTCLFTLDDAIATARINSPAASVSAFPGLKKGDFHNPYNIWSLPDYPLPGNSRGAQRF